MKAMETTDTPDEVIEGINVLVEKYLLSQILISVAGLQTYRESENIIHYFGYTDKGSLRTRSLSKLCLSSIKYTQLPAIFRISSKCRMKHVERRMEIRFCCNLISSSFVYNAKMRTFIPSFLEPYSLIVYCDHSKTGYFNIRHIYCDLLSLILICLLVVKSKNHLFHVNISNILDCLWFSITINDTKGNICYPEKKSLTFCDMNEKYDKCLLKKEELLYTDKVVQLRAQTTENQDCSVTKQFYGDVDLKTLNYGDGLQMGVNDEQAEASKDNKHRDDGLDSLKRTVRDNTELPYEKQQRADKFIVAPASKSKKQKKRRPLQSEDLQDSQPQPDENLDSTPIESQPTSSYVTVSSRKDATELDQAESIVENASSQINIDGAQCLSPSSSEPLKNNNVEKNTFDVGACQGEAIQFHSNGYACALPSKEMNDNVGAKAHVRTLVGQPDSDIIVANDSNQLLVKKEMNGHTVSNKPQLNAPGSIHSSSVGVPVVSDSGQTFPSPNSDNSNTERFEPLMNIINKIADGERVPPQITMRYEMLRFCTLRSFPKENKPYISRIAAAGFYYANTGDEVVCYSCARRKSNWRENDDPMEIHRQLNPNCSYLLRNSEVNVPVRTSILSNNSSRTRTYSTQRTNTDQINIQSDSTPNASNSVVTSLDSNNGQQSSSSSTGSLNRNLQAKALTQQLRAHGNFVSSNTSSPSSSSNQQSSANNRINEPSSTFTPVTSGSQNIEAASSNGTSPKYPKYASKPARLVSFNECGDIIIPPDSLATSGFFYAGFGDCVRCFHCGVGLRHWSDEDDPWIEHCRWSKDCLFVKEVKGQEFVNLVQMAVQYSQNNSNTENRTQIPVETNSDTTNGNDIENLMHTNAAQSVLEMGYHPDIIRRAIHAINNVQITETLSAANLMEKIFEFEANDANESSDTTSTSVPSRLSSDQINRAVPSTVNSNSRETAVQRDSLSRSRSEGGNSQVPSSSENQASGVALIAGSETKGSSLSSNMSGSLHSRTTKKSQLLEQKKLQEENQQLKQQSLCIKCKKNDVCIVFLPCGHLVTCETCAPTIRYCTVEGCGRYIKGTVRTYLA